MTEKIVYWTSVLFSGLALLLFVANTALIRGNSGLQAELNQRQAVIANGSNLTPLNQNLAQALAEIAVKDDDNDLRDLLSSQGISIRKNDDQAETAHKSKKK